MKADVFFIYPTVIEDEDAISKEAGYCDVNNSNMRFRCRLLLASYGGIFPQCNIFAPYYRQYCVGYLKDIATKALQSNNPSPKVLEDAIAAVPLKDCIAAFEHYLKNYDRGRPIIFGSDSQGTMIMKQLLLWIKDKHPDILANRTIAAYMIGFAITDDYLEQLADLGIHFVQDEADIKCIITYNTESPAALEKNKDGVVAYSYFCNNPLYPNCKVVNPINWKTDATKAYAPESRGSYLQESDVDGAVSKPPQMNFVDAVINTDRATVITTAPVKYGEDWPQGCLHPYDFALFYGDLQANIATRIAAWYASTKNNPRQPIAEVRATN
jgi:hypothetical protein